MQDSRQSNDYPVSEDKRLDIAVYLDGVMRYAESMADLVGQHLKLEAESAADKPLSSCGNELRNHDLLKRVTDPHLDSDAFRTSCDSMRNWLENYAWNVPVEMNCDVTLERCDAESLVDEIAQFLWDFSHLARDTPDSDRI